MNDLRVLADREIDQAAEAFFGLLCDRQTELMQRERIVLRVENSRRNACRTANRAFDVAVRVRVPGVDVAARRNPRRLEDLVERRRRRRLGLGERSPRSGKEGGNGGSNQHFFHWWTFLE